MFAFSSALDDYTRITSQTVTFPPGTNTQVVSIPTITDEVGEETETFTAVLSSPSAGTTIGVGTATVEIEDDTSVLVEFDPAVYSGREDSGYIVFEVVKRTTTTKPCDGAAGTAVGKGNSM